MSNTHPSLLPFDLTPELIDQLKEQYGKVYKVTAAGIDFVIRPLYKEDWKEVLEMIESNEKLSGADVDDKIVDIALVGPRPDFTKGGWAALPAGVVSTLSIYIRAKSGFVVPEAPEALSIRVEPMGTAVVGPRPTEEEVTAMKSKCPFTVRLISIEGEYFAIRPITRQEWRAAVNAGQAEADDAVRDMEVTRRVVMWPKAIDWDKKPAGYCETISNFALGVSGYVISPDVEEL